MILHFPIADNSEGYIALARRLRELFRFTSKPYLLTGSPQCVVPDANMGAMIAAVKFDLLFIQFYNTFACSAASWANSRLANPANSNHSFTFDAWSAWLTNTSSRDAQLFIGLAGSPAAANSGFYVPLFDVQRLIHSYACRPPFGGVAIWDATYADSNRLGEEPYYEVLKQYLEAVPACSNSLD